MSFVGSVRYSQWHVVECIVEPENITTILKFLRQVRYDTFLYNYGAGNLEFQFMFSLPTKERNTKNKK